MADLGTEPAQAPLTLGAVNIDLALEVAQTALALVASQTLLSRTL